MGSLHYPSNLTVLLATSVANSHLKIPKVINLIISLRLRFSSRSGVTKIEEKIESLAQVSIT